MFTNFSQKKNNFPKYFFSKFFLSFQNLYFSNKNFKEVLKKEKKKVCSFQKNFNLWQGFQLKNFKSFE